MCNRPAPIPSSLPIVATADCLFLKGASSHRIPTQDISAAENQRSHNSVISRHLESKLTQYSYPPPSGINDPLNAVSTATGNQSSLNTLIPRHRESTIRQLLYPPPLGINAHSILLSPAIGNQRSVKCCIHRHWESRIRQYFSSPPSGVNARRYSYTRHASAWHAHCFIVAMSSRKISVLPLRPSRSRGPSNY
jgi:hypothetical protein